MIDWAMLTRVKKRKSNIDVPFDLKKSLNYEKNENKSVLTSSSDRLKCKIAP
jgi:hypothetical protein